MMFSRSDMNIPDGPFTSDRLSYEKLSVCDEDAMWEMVSSDTMMRYVPYTTEIDPATWRETFHRQMAEGERYKFFYGFRWRDENTVYTEEKDILGLVILRPLEDGSMLEVGYWVREAYWGMGLATEVNSRMVSLAESDLNTNPKHLMATVMLGNDASRKVLEKSGFKVVGELMEDTGACWDFRRDI